MRSQFEQFRALVEADASLQQELSQPYDPCVFAALAVERARHHGLGLAAEEVAEAVRANRQVPITGPADEGGARLPPCGWLPLRTRWRDQQFEVQWGYAGPQPLHEPFFEDSVARCTTTPFNRLFGCSTPIEALAGGLQEHRHVPPSGFIFHMSRCGSTLVSQMLAAMARTIVVSEAGPIDAVVQARRTRPDLRDEQHAEWLRWMIGALGRARSGEEQRFFVKLDSWHVLALPLFRRAFPAVPWIFLYRDPVEVLVSQLRRRGMHMVPGLLDPAIFGFEASQAMQAPANYCAQVLERICDGVLREYAPGAGLLLNYRQLPAALWTDVLPHFAVPCSERDRLAMAEAARYDAKSPDLPFANDSVAKQAGATDQIRSAAQQLGGLHARLEALRLGA
jgi:hypothetical protein